MPLSPYCPSVVVSFGRISQYEHTRTRDTQEKDVSESKCTEKKLVLGKPSLYIENALYVVNALTHSLAHLCFGQLKYRVRATTKRWTHQGQRSASRETILFQTAAKQEWLVE
jgi:hypothetical protein